MIKTINYVFLVGMMCVYSLIINYDIGHSGFIEWITVTQTTNTLNQDSKKVIDTSSITWNPIIDGTNTVIGKNAGFKWTIDWIIAITTTSYTTSLSEATKKIQNVINRSLGLLALLCVIYLIYEWVVLLFNFDDDKAQSTAFEAIKKVAWVIGWIWLTWFIVSAIFFIVSKFV